MSLDGSISKTISVAAFFGLTFAPSDGPRGNPPHPGELKADHTLSASPGPGVGLRIESDAKAKSVEPSPELGEQDVCARGMVLVEGDYCPDADQVCLKWLDPPPYQNLRCGEYEKPAKCKVPRQHRRFCVDREEFAERSKGTLAKDALPVVNKSWGEAKALCEARGVRLCKESEWEFACEGVDMSPYPYGFKRDASLCNHDRTDLGGAEEKLNDHRAPVSAFPACTSTFGVHDMVGNVDEWVEREGQGAPHRSALRGGWWLPGRNRCRAATTHHPEGYRAKQVGFRCCANAP